MKVKTAATMTKDEDGRDADSKGDRSVVTEDESADDNKIKSVETMMKIQIWLKKMKVHAIR